MANTKVSQLSLATPAGSDYGYFVDDPASSPASRAMYLSALTGLTGVTELGAGTLVGATSVAVRGKPAGITDNSIWVVIDPFTTECEVRKVTTISGLTLTVAALAYSHSAKDPVIFTHNSKLSLNWFGAKGDGVTDDTTAINRALAATNTSVYGATRAGRIVVEAQADSIYLITSPLNMCEMQGVILDGGSPNFGAILLGQTNGKAMIEIIGSQDITISNLNVYGSSILTPAVGIFTSRSNTTHGVNSANIACDNVQFGGYFTQTPVYVVESESNYFRRCNWYTTGGTMTTCALLCRANELALTPVNATLGDHGYGLTFIYFDKCLISNQGGVRCIHLHDAAGDVHVHNSYLYATTVPAIEIEGGAKLYCKETSSEGTPNYTIYLNYDAGAAGNSYELYLDTFGFGSPTSHSIYADDSTLLKNSSIKTSIPGISGGARMPVRLYQAEGCDFTGLAEYVNGVFDITFDSAAGYSSHCRYRLELDDTLTFSGGATSYADIIENMVTGSSEYVQVPALKLSKNATAIATDLRTVTSTWDIGSLADGAVAKTAILVTGVEPTNWIAFAALDSLDEQGWILSAYPFTGGVCVTAVNHSGGVIDPPSGTLRVVAMKVA